MHECTAKHQTIRPMTLLQKKEKHVGSENTPTSMKEEETHWLKEPALSILPGMKCYTSEVLTASGRLQRSELYEQSVHNGSVINVKEFAADLRTRLCRVWNGSESVETRGHNHKWTTYHCWFASPLNPVSAEAAPYKVPIYLNLDLGRHVQQRVSCFTRMGVLTSRDSLLTDWNQVGPTVFCYSERKDYASQVQLRALRKGPLTSKLATLRLATCYSEGMGSTDSLTHTLDPQL
eukprot:1153128-Pelagomonas_calceolata.AAC.1